MITFLIKVFFLFFVNNDKAADLLIIYSDLLKLQNIYILVCSLFICGMKWNNCKVFARTKYSNCLLFKILSKSVVKLFNFTMCYTDMRLLMYTVYHRNVFKYHDFFFFFHLANFIHNISFL